MLCHSSDAIILIILISHTTLWKNIYIVIISLCRNVFPLPDRGRQLATVARLQYFANEKPLLAANGNALHRTGSRPCVASDLILRVVYACTRGRFRNSWILMSWRICFILFFKTPLPSNKTIIDRLIMKIICYFHIFKTKMVTLMMIKLHFTIKMTSQNVVTLT